MHPSLQQDLARVQIADRVRQAEQARLCRAASTPRAPRRRQPIGWKVQWPTLWMPRPTVRFE